MVIEFVILRWIKHFEQGRGRITTRILRHFVDFIEQEQRIFHANFSQMLHDFARHCADVGAPMTPNFGFITHPAECHPYKLTASGFGDRFTQTGFTDSWRTDQAQHWATQLFDPRLYRQIFDDAVFDFGQTVVIRVQNLLGFVQFDRDFAGFFPRRVQDPVEVVAHHRRFT